MNKRGLFGMSYGPIWVHYALPLIGMCLVVYFALRSSSRWSSVAFGLILGGGLGNNLIDRVRLGSVIDFIDFGLGDWRWYTFNLADAFVVVGVIMLLGYEFLGPKQGTVAPSAADPEPGKLSQPPVSGQD
jgi:signal peptidase II